MTETRIQRYATVTDDGFMCFKKHPHGNAVLFADHQALVKKLEVIASDSRWFDTQCARDIRKALGVELDVNLCIREPKGDNDGDRN